MRHEKRSSLVKGAIPAQLFSLTWPGIGGSLAITVFNLTDTFFVSRLGTDALAAMGFTFPVILIVAAAASGISMGSGSVLSRALGSGDSHLMKRTATDGILLSVFLVGLISTAGIFTLDILFTAMGAEGEVLSLVKDYMLIWYIGSVAIIMPPVSDSCLRATGDMVRPFVVMMVCAGINAALDPVLIFGYFGFPAMGIKGAAVATVFSRCAGMVATLSFLHFNAGLLDFTLPSPGEIRDSWKRILHIGIPSAFTQLLYPLTRGVVTSLAALAGGSVAVASVASGSRIESFAVIIVRAYSMALVPMIGQNTGAGKWDRIREIRSVSAKLSLYYGFTVIAAALVFAPQLSGIFSTDISVIENTVIYLRITALAAGAFAYYTWTGQSLNAAGLPGPSALLNSAGILVFQIPLSWAGVSLYGFKGLVTGLALGQLITSFIAVHSGRKNLSR